jgi:hypothetical protein
MLPCSPSASRYTTLWSLLHNYRFSTLFYYTVRRSESILTHNNRSNENELYGKYKVDPSSEGIIEIDHLFVAGTVALARNALYGSKSCCPARLGRPLFRLPGTMSTTFVAAVPFSSNAGSAHHFHNAMHTKNEERPYRRLELHVLDLA